MTYNIVSYGDGAPNAVIVSGIKADSDAEAMRTCLGWMGADSDAWQLWTDGAGSLVATTPEGWDIYAVQQRRKGRR